MFGIALTSVKVMTSKKKKKREILESFFNYKKTGFRPLIKLVLIYGLLDLENHKIHDEKKSKS